MESRDVPAGASAAVEREAAQVGDERANHRPESGTVPEGADVSPTAPTPASPGSAPRVTATQLQALAETLERCDWKAPDTRCAKGLQRYLSESRGADDAGRAHALAWLSHPAKTHVSAIVARLVEMVRTDPSQTLRRRTCRRLGRVRDPRVLATLSKYSLRAVSETDPGLYAACFGGLVRLWADPHHPSEPMAQAYRFTLKRLQTKPRSSVLPPAAVLQQLRSLPTATDASAHTPAQRRWLTKSRAFFSVAALTDAVEAVAMDPAVPWQSRLVAVELLIHLRLPHSRLEQLAARIDGETVSLGPQPNASKSLQRRHLKAISERLRRAMKPPP